MKPRIDTFPDGTALLYADTLILREDDAERQDSTGIEAPIYWMPAAHDITAAGFVRYMASAYYEGRVVIETGEYAATLKMSFEDLDRLYTAYLKERPRFAFSN